MQGQNYYAQPNQYFAMTFKENFHKKMYYFILIHMLSHYR